MAKAKLYFVTNIKLNREQTMKVHERVSNRVLITLLVGLCIWGLLIWQHFHHGVPSHHLLNRADMPAISNWWGAIILPLLTWFLVAKTGLPKGETSVSAALWGFIAAFCYGVVFSAAFIGGHGSILDLMLPGLLVIALFIPIYRPKYVLGMVFGMAYTFGAFLPTVFVLVFGLLSFIIFNYIRPLPLYVFGKLSGRTEQK
jgi:hypothetical protein